MTTAFNPNNGEQPDQNQSAGDHLKQKQDKKIGCGCGLALLLLIGLMMALGGGDEDKDQAEETAVTSQEQAPTEESAPPTQGGGKNATPPNLAEGVDPYMGPQEWADEYYRERNCASQVFPGGLAVCTIRGFDMDEDNTMLVGYIDQDEPGVQEFYDMEVRRDNMIESFAGIVSQAKFDGEPRVQHVTHVRLIASGGEGFGSGWQRETEVP